MRTDGIYDDRVEFETFTVAIPISASFTRHLDVQAPTADAALLLATEHALDTGVLMHGEPWIVKGADETCASTCPNLLNQHRSTAPTP